MTRILILDGHPDPDPARFLHALAGAYAAGAVEAGHEVTRIEVSALDVPPLRSAAEWQGPPPGPVREVQQAMAEAQHIVLLYPLWLGDIPAALKALFEQVFRPGFAFPAEEAGLGKGLLKGRSVRVVVTMGMPALLYRWFFLAHSLRSLERNMLGFVGLGPIRRTLIGGIGGASDAARRAWLDRLRALGAQGA